MKLKNYINYQLLNLKEMLLQEENDSVYIMALTVPNINSISIR